MSAPLTGRVLGGRWALEARVASGSYATVYRAVDATDGTVYAVKILTEVATPEAESRFRAEYEMLRRFSHPAIVRGHAVGTVEGRPYMVLDYVSGGNVLSLLDDGPLDAGAAARIALQVLAGLAEAHGAGVVHRDVKPGNVLVDDAGDARLCDFGIARVTGASAAKLTQVGTRLGTLLYMAPEQRLDASAVDLTADIYSVGCLLYRLVTDETPADLFALDADAPRWEAVPPALRPIVLRATRTNPADRYPDAREMAAALLELLPAASRVTLGATFDPWCYPVPDPGVRVGAHAEAPAAPNATKKPPRSGDKVVGGGTGLVRPDSLRRAGPLAPPAPRASTRTASPWPWRFALGVFFVVVIAVIHMTLTA